MTAKATIVSGNTGATNCDAPAATSSYGLEGPSSGDTSCGFDLPSANPQLEPLADNGGPTETQALSPSSPAVDAVPAAKCPTKVDQRGEPRPDNGKAFCDVGAYELQDPPVAPTVTSAAAATFQTGKAASFIITATGLPAPSLSEVGALPNGVSFTDKGDGTASLAGTPPVGTGGSYQITIKASNGALPDAAQSFALTVQAPPTASIATPLGGATYTKGQVAAAGFTCAEGAGGPGIASCVDQDGHPSGAPLVTATTGQHNLTVTVISKDGLTSRRTLPTQSWRRQGRSPALFASPRPRLLPPGRRDRGAPALARRHQGPPGESDVEWMHGEVRTPARSLGQAADCAQGCPPSRNRGHLPAAQWLCRRDHLRDPDQRRGGADRTSATAAQDCDARPVAATQSPEQDGVGR